MRVNRRFLLLSGLGATIAAVLGREQWQRSAAEAEQAKLRQLYNPQTLVQEAFQSDVVALQDLRAVQQSARLRSPTLAYNRQWTKLLIIGSKLSTHQYLRGKFDPNYDGSISALPLHSQGFTTFQQMGKVHLGIYDFYQSDLAQSVRAAIKSIDPKIPLLIAEHSLGAALATLAAMDLALLYPKLQPNLQLYTYASPRVGDREFVEAHSNLIPNHYRIVNLADTIPLLPMSRQLNAEFVHGGEQWSFLSYQGDIVPNHLVETYHNAIAQEVETKFR